MPVRAVLQVLAGALVGAVAGALGTYAHPVVVGAHRWPVGVALAVAFSGCAARTTRLLMPAPLVRVALLLAWFAVVLPAAGRRREGDLLIVADGRGTAWLVLGAAVTALALVLPAARRRRPGG